jgi:hypothetical protein
VKPCVSHPDAGAELLEAGRHYREISPAPAERFHGETALVLDEIRERPALRRMFATPARRHFGTVFPFAVVYVERAEELLIPAVMHFRQKPGYWRERLQ